MAKAKKPVGDNKAKIEKEVEDAVVVDETLDTVPDAVEITEAGDEGGLSDDISDKPAEPPEPEKTKSSFFPLLIGGVISGAIGFGAASYYFINQPSDVAQNLAQLETTLGEQKTKLATASTEITGLSEVINGMKSDTSTSQALADLASATEKQSSDLAILVSGVSDRITDIDTRLTALEKRPVTEAGGMTSEAAAAYERELQTMRSLLETQRSDIEKLAANATARIESAAKQAETLEQTADATAKMAAQRVAVSQLQMALDSGAAFDSTLSNLAATIDTDIPQVLKDSAKGGVPTLAALQDTFPASARAALAASVKATSGDGVMDKLGLFFQSQVGGRSLEPREGDDPDAVLSRAEAAIINGDINAALALVSALPDAGQSAMAEWVTAASTRNAAVEAIGNLTNSLNGN